MGTVLAFLGLAFGISWTVAASPLFTSLTYLTLRARSVLAPTLLHGSFNAVASLSLVCLTGAGELLVGPVGIAGIGAGLLATAACVVHDRDVAAGRVTTGTPLVPWSR